MNRLSALTIGLVLTSGLGISASTTAVPARALTRQEAAQRILQSQYLAHLSAPALAAIQMIGRGDNRVTPDSPMGSLSSSQTRQGGGRTGGPSPVNVLVSNPSEDVNFVDQTTQSETSIGVSGQNIAIGFNDSQNALRVLTAGYDISGYAYSRDGGRSFIDGGVLPNAPATQNAGDPWLAESGDGDMYYSTIAIEVTGLGVGVRISRSTDGGRTWGEPVSAYQGANLLSAFADKDAVAAHLENVYAAWSDFAVDSSGLHSGLAFSRSADRGLTWNLSYLDRFGLDNAGCSMRQYDGAAPFIDGTSLLVAAEQISVDDPACMGVAPTLSEVVFKSTDGGRSFGSPVRIGDVHPVPTLMLGPGQMIRTAEFPSLARSGNVLFASWNDYGTGLHSHIRLAKSNDGGLSWETAYVTSGSGDELQPAISGDAAGIHIAYYERNSDNTLDVLLTSSRDGVEFKSDRITSQSFPGVETIPNFDPIFSWNYMGDYIANLTVHGHQYLSWGDNRNIVRNFLWPSGRHDPDVFFALH